VVDFTVVAAIPRLADTNPAFVLVCTRHAAHTIFELRPLTRQAPWMTPDVRLVNGAPQKRYRCIPWEARACLIGRSFSVFYTVDALAL
jgi:hypothetical protein